MEVLSEVRTIANHVRDAIRWDPRLDFTKTDVQIVNGVAVLTGTVGTLLQRGWCQEIVQRVRGITGVNNQLEVRPCIGDYRTDETLQRLIPDLIDALAGLPAVRPDVTVRDGWVTLRGSVRWWFQKELVENAITGIAGVRGIANLLTIDRTGRTNHVGWRLL